MKNLLSPEFLSITISDMARSFSRKRKIEHLYGHADALDYLIPSTSDEMAEDMIEASSHTSLYVLKRIIPFENLASESYMHLEKTWLRREKAILAYFYWCADPYKGAVIDFNNSASEIRSWLLERKRVNLDYFGEVENYLMDSYLVKADLLDETKEATQRLIEGKARRIWKMTGEQNEKRNWFRARLYVKLFYENIIGAVRDSDVKKTAKILEAFEFSKSAENKLIIINAFETALAIEFLDKKVINNLKSSPAYNLNMVAIDFWPQKLDNLELSGGQLSYSKDSAQLFFEGIMSEDEKIQLLEKIDEEIIRKDELKVALEHLYAQSLQKPFEKQIF